MKIEAKDCWIPMSDGARLGARIWTADDNRKPSPVILEYIPYRKDDFTAARDSATIAWFAGHGYVCVRVDMRGSGSSDGVLYDEYSETEIDDGVEVVEWLARQTWCDGNVGTIGISWGGISGLLLASRNPKALKALIAVGATEFRYYDDGGYYMGCMVGQTIGWAAIMFGYNARPPDPGLIGDRWRDLWLKRLDKAPHYLEQWLTHQREDDYWLRGSVGVDYSSITIPVYAVSGHYDCWPNTVSRLLQNLDCPTRGLQGPWCHRYPHMGIPGPQIGFLQDARRWFDEWLKGMDTGIMREDRYLAYLMDGVDPQPYYDHRPGRWVGEPAWPSPNVTDLKLFLDNGSLEYSQPAASRLEIHSPQTVGLQSGEYMPWFAFGISDEMPGDQQDEDRGSLVFDSAPLEHPLSILGNPQLRLKLSCNQSEALIAVRICDVGADGKSTLISRGIKNLCYRHGKDSPQALSVDETHTVDIGLNHTGYVVPRNHRLRVAVSTSYWPMAWPTPYPATVTVDTGVSELSLPIRSASNPGRVSRFEPPIAPEPTVTTQELRPGKLNRSVRAESESGFTELIIDSDNGKVRFSDNGLEMGSRSLQQYSIHPDDPLTASAQYEWQWEFARGAEWQTTTLARTKMTCDRNFFYLATEMTAWEGESEIYRRSENKKFPRDFF